MVQALSRRFGWGCSRKLIDIVPAHLLYGHVQRSVELITAYTSLKEFQLIIPFHLCGLCRSRLNFRLYCRMCPGILSSIVLSKWFTEFCVFSSQLLPDIFILNKVSLVQPLTVLKHCISTDCILFTSLANEHKMRNAHGRLHGRRF
jgi:hypothetical protein